MAEVESHGTLNCSSLSHGSAKYAPLPPPGQNLAYHLNFDSFIGVKSLSFFYILSMSTIGLSSWDWDYLVTKPKIFTSDPVQKVCWTLSAGLIIRFVSRVSEVCSPGLAQWSNDVTEGHRLFLVFCSFILVLLPHGHRLTTALLRTMSLGRKKLDNISEQDRKTMSAKSIALLAKKTDFFPEVFLADYHSFSLGQEQPKATKGTSRTGIKHLAFHSLLVEKRDEIARIGSSWANVACVICYCCFLWTT